nr:metalloregulator ArsR/SmtB family transcription factor [Candidatus Freyarchaeota archaeon]
MKVPPCCASDPSVEGELEEELKTELDNIPKEENLEKYGELLFSLAHPIRLKIAYLLLIRDHCVCELTQLLGKEPNLVSHHLTVLRKNGIVTSYMSSKWKYYKLNEIAANILKEIEKI